jgi:hypothetical protein
VAFLALVMGTVYSSYGIWESRASASWPHVTGRVARSYLEICSSKPRRWGPAIAYVYTVDGRGHLGSSVGSEFREVCDQDRNAVLGWLKDHYPEGKLVEVYYKPSNPDAAFLVAAQVTYRDIFRTAILLAFTIIFFPFARSRRSA